MTLDFAVPPAPMSVTGWMTASDGARIPYRMKGAGPALIMVHGWSQSGAMFQHQLDALSDRYTVIVPDVRGHGEAPDPPGGLRMARLGKDVHELIEHLELDHVNLLGWSMGVSVLWAYIDLYGTGTIGRLVFVDQPSMLTVLPGMTEQDVMNAGALFTVPELYALYGALRGSDGKATRAGFVQGMVTPTISPVLYEWVLAENATTSCDVAAELLLSHCTNDWRDLLPRIDRPVLVIAGSVSHVQPRSQQYIAERIQGATYHEFDADHGGAHFPFLEAPGAFNQVVGSFLDAR